MTEIHVSELHAQRFLRRHPYVRDSLVARHGRAPDWRPDLEDIAYLKETILPDLEEAMKRAKKTDPALLQRRLHEVSEVGIVAGNFINQVQPSIVVSARLVEMLARTRLGKLRLEDLSWPFELSYIALEKPIMISLAQGTPSLVDGFYVEAAGKAPRFLFTSRVMPELGEGVEDNVILRHEPVLSLGLAEGGKALVERIAAGLARERFEAGLAGSAGQETAQGAKKVYGTLMSLALNVAAYLTLHPEAVRREPSWTGAGDDGLPEISFDAVLGASDKPAAFVAEALHQIRVKGALPYFSLDLPNGRHAPQEKITAAENHEGHIWQDGRWKMTNRRGQLQLEWSEPEILTREEWLQRNNPGLRGVA